MVFVCHVTDEFLSAFARNDEVFEYIDDETGEKVEKINDPYRIGLPKKRRIGKKYINSGIINFAASQLRKDLYRPKVNIAGLFLGIWHKNNDQWDRYDILRGRLPTLEDAAQTDLFMLTGSHFSVNDSIPEVEKTM